MIVTFVVCGSRRQMLGVNEFERRLRISFVERNREDFVGTSDSKKPLAVVTSPLAYYLLGRLAGRVADGCLRGSESLCSNLLQSCKRYCGDSDQQRVIGLDGGGNIRSSSPNQVCKVQCRRCGRGGCKFAHRSFDLRPIAMSV